jgi:hypothetical protein
MKYHLPEIYIVEKLVGSQSCKKIGLPVARNFQSRGRCVWLYELWANLPDLRKAQLLFQCIKDFGSLFDREE